MDRSVIIELETKKEVNDLMKALTYVYLYGPKSLSDNPTIKAILDYLRGV